MQSIKFFRNFLLAAREHRKVEEKIQLLLDEFLDGKYIRDKGRRLGMARYAQKNFFSILFLSVYKALGIARERRMLYGVINHCLRGLVTGTDNLLDNEYKEMLPLNLPDEAVRFKSVMHILLFDRFLFRMMNQLVDDGVVDRQVAAGINVALFGAMVPIGAGEAREEGGVKEIISPAAILDSVHMYKGGKLLCLSFVAPLLVEKEQRERIVLAEQGIFCIGMALQVIDDLTDFYADLRDRRHNYLVSVIHHEGTVDERSVLGQALAERSGDGPAIEETFQASVGLVMERAIGEALQGFELLARAGYWLDRQQAVRLIRQLFRLRGVQRLLPFFPAEEDIRQTLTSPGHDAMPAKKF
ncbi:MAG: class 1 isoprenoid biosynthesis enzyme [Deltaproteobacteria bacterium]|nr:class 1 isoprenoid biosynthesis enzyme [Deltaproteobacteria bacterium]